MGGMGPGFGGGSFAAFDASAAVLGLTPVELFTQLHDGKSMEEIAKAKGVAMDKIHEAVKAARLAEARTRLAQAVKEGKITQAQADQAIKDIEAGRWPGHGHGGPHGPGGPPRERA